MKYPIKIGIIGGSGLDDPKIFENVSSHKVDTPFGLPSDELLVGEIHEIPCVMLARHGRKHNIPPTKVNYRANIWAMKEFGCTHVLVSSACGSLKEDIRPGDIVIPDSFIDLTKHRELTFYNSEGPFGKSVLHIPGEPAFCNETRKCLIRAANEMNIDCHESGTSVVIEGPRFSTLAESNLYRSWGADLVNMTLSPEVMLAKELGLCYACVAMSTDYDCWNSESEKVNVQNVVKTFQENVLKVKNILLKAVTIIARQNWESIIDENMNLIKSSIQSQN